MDKSRISRRAMLGMLSVALPVRHVSAAFCSMVIDENMTDRLLGMFTHRSSAAAIGAAYLTSRSDAPDEEGLIGEFLHTDFVSATALNEMTASELRRHVQERVARDFRSGHVTHVNGWVLSDSEVLLYALAAVTTQILDKSELGARS